MGIQGIPWESGESHGNPMGIQGIRWESRESDGNPGNPGNPKSAVSALAKILIKISKFFMNFFKIRGASNRFLTSILIKGTSDRGRASNMGGASIMGRGLLLYSLL